MGDKSLELDVLELVRFGSTPHAEADEGKEKEKEAAGGDEHCFFMLDYFDFLLHTHLTGSFKTYNAFLGMTSLSGGQISIGISGRVVSLYRETGRGQDKEDEAIWGVHGESDSLSQKPLLGLIQVSFTPQFYNMQRSPEEKAAGHIRQELKQAEDELRRVMAGCDYQIYRVMTTGNLYVILRTDRCTDIYDSAIRIGSVTVGNGQTKFLTYTHVGIECLKREGRYLTFSEEYVKSHSEEKYIVRFSSSKDIHDLIRGINHPESPIKGLFGRYDFQVELSIEEFAELYPELCSFKASSPEQKKEEFDYKVGKEIAERGSLVNVLAYGLHCRKLKILNERLYVPLFSRQPENTFSNLEETSFENTIELRNTDLKRRYAQLKRWEHKINEGRRNFKDSYRALGEIIETYGPLGYEPDAYMNWKIYERLLNILFDNIDFYEKMIFEKLSGSPRSASFQAKFLESFRISVDAINQFVRLLQNVNQQTMQAPNYEIQTHIDAEKLILAYSEYMNQYMQGYQCYDWTRGDGTCGEIRLKVFPIIYPDLSCDGPVVNTPFNTGLEKDVGLMEDSDLNGREVLLVCRVPSFEYFGRMFELLPWAVHEVSHHMLILERERRNEFIVAFALRYIMRELFHGWAIEHSKDRILHPYSRAEETIVGILTKYYSKLFEKYEGDKWKGCKISYLRYCLVSFLSGYGSNYELRKQDAGTMPDQQKRQILIKYFLEYALELGNEELLEKVKNLGSGSRDTGSGRAAEDEIIALLFREWTDVFLDRMDWSAANSDLGKSMIRPDSEAFITQLGIDIKRDRTVLEGKIDELSSWIQGEISANHQAEKYILPALREYCFQILDLNRLNTVVGMGGEEEKIIQEDFLKECRQDTIRSLQKELKNYRNPHFTDSYTYDPQIAQIVNELEVDFKNENRFFDNWEEHMRGYDVDMLNSLVNKSWSVYRETCADLIMCRVISFSAFGYFHFVVNTLCNVNAYGVSLRKSGVNWERVKLVLAVLIGNYEKGTIPCEDFREKITQYSESELEYVAERICEEFNAADRYKSEVMENLLTGFRGINNMALESWKSGDSSAIKRIHADLSGSYRMAYDSSGDPYAGEELKNCIDRNWYRLKMICRMMELSSEIITENRLWVDENSYEHFRLLYQSTGREDGGTGCCWQDGRRGQYECEAIARIAEFYNTPGHMEAGFDAASMLEYTIRFVEEYYYRERIGQEAVSDGRQA